MATKPKTDDTAPNQEVLSAMEDAPTTTAVARQSPSSLALGTISGDVGPADMKLPRLQIAYGVGKLSESFNPGDWVLEQQYHLASKQEPLSVIILSANQFWKEYLTFGEGTLPRIFQTKEDVLANGGTVEWENGVGPSFSKAMDINMLIRKPDDLVCGLFGAQIGDGVYSPAVLSIDKSAFRKLGPVITTMANFTLRERGINSALFDLKTVTEKIGKNLTVVPQIALARHLTDEELEQLNTFFGS